MAEITGKTPADETVAFAVDRIKEIYANGRRASLKEEEFKRILQELNVQSLAIPSLQIENLRT